LVGFYIKFVKAKAIFTVPWSAKSPFFHNTTMPFLFSLPAKLNWVIYLWLNFIRANAYHSFIKLLLQVTFFKMKKVAFNNNEKKSRFTINVERDF
jgi:hypothetical protein